MSRTLLWFLHADRPGGFFGLDAPDVSGLPRGAELLREKSPMVDHFRFPDLGYSVFGTCLITIWAATLTGGESVAIKAGSVILAAGVFFVIDDYNLLSQMYGALERRLPPQPAIWRLGLVLVLSVLSIVVALGVGWRLGVAVFVLTVPGFGWVLALLLELREEPMGLAEFCKLNPAYAKYLIASATESLIETDEMSGGSDQKSLIEARERLLQAAEQSARLAVRGPDPVPGSGSP